MRIIHKKHHYYPNLMSEDITIFETKNTKYSIQEYYGDTLHYLSINKWVRGEADGNLFVLRKWKHIPLNIYTFKLFKTIPKDNRLDKNLSDKLDKFEYESKKLDLSNRR